MKKSILFLQVAVLLGFASCSEEPRSKEQYKKEIYLIGAYNDVASFPLKYSRTEDQEIFITISSSGTHDISENAIIEIGVDPKIVDNYNYRYFPDDQKYKYFRVLKDEYYDIKTMRVELIASEGVSTNVPIKINTVNLHCDSTYVIPFRLLSTTEYSLGKDSTLMLRLEMENDYTGEYKMTGEIDGERIGRSKMISPVHEDKVRIRIAGKDDDNDETNIASHTVVLTIAEDGSVVITDWDTTQGIYDVSGAGTYDKVKKVFSINYEYSDDDGEHICEEVLTFIP